MCVNVLVWEHLQTVKLNKSFMRAAHVNIKIPNSLNIIILEYSVYQDYVFIVLWQSVNPPRTSKDGCVQLTLASRSLIIFEDVSP